MAVDVEVEVEVKVKPKKSLQTGSHVGKYKLISCLGVGGMGEVWTAEQESLSRKVAIKVIKPDVIDVSGATDGKMLMKRFEREAKATSLLTSPNTVELYDFGVTDDGIFYYTMELLQGLDLKTLVDRYGAITPERVIDFMLQTCDSLAEAHEVGLVHRDIKPANLFVCRRGMKHDFIKVLDFGLVKLSQKAKEDTQLTEMGGVPGSPAFMAPEMVQGHTIDAQADIYSLGCLAYWLLTGELLFQKDTALQAALAHVNEEPLPPSELSPYRIPPELDRIILDCLQKSPQNRPSGMLELSRRLSKVPLRKVWNEERASHWWQVHLSHDQILSDSENIPLSPFEDTHQNKAPGWPVGMRESDISNVRNGVVRELQNHFALSYIDINEFDRRAELAIRAESPVELAELLKDLPAQQPPKLTPPPQIPKPMTAPPENSMAPAEGQNLPARIQPDKTFYGIVSGASRAGNWKPPKYIGAIAMFGGVDLDFRQAEMQEGMTLIEAHCVMGGVQITVSPETYVEVDGVAIMGAFNIRGNSIPDEPPKKGSWLRVTGWALMGGVEVKVKKVPKKNKLFQKFLG